MISGDENLKQTWEEPQCGSRAVYATKLSKEVLQWIKWIKEKQEKEDEEKEKRNPIQGDVNQPSCSWWNCD